MNVSFMLDRGTPPRLSPVFAETASLLEARGISVHMCFPEHELTRIDQLTVAADLYLLKSNTSLAFALMTVLHHQGARLVNRLDACRVVRDKVVTATTLSTAGIPVPRSLLGADTAHFASELAGGSLIFKPHRGAYGRGIRIAGSVARLPRPTDYPELVFAQDFLHGARTDLKVYAIGEELFAVRKSFGTDSFLGAGEMVRLTPDIEDIVRRVGQALGLELYGVDLAESEAGLHVIDVNMMPGYRGVPNAARRIAAYIQCAASHA
jgi:ribosomal protein S6--L-glutamate ligase